MTRIKAYCIFITLAVAQLGAQAGNVEDALSQFNAKPTVTTATTFFDLLKSEEFLDTPPTMKADTPVDTLREQVWYWAAEWFYDTQQYKLTEEYGLKSLKLLQAGNNRNGEADCLNLLAITYIRVADFPNAAKYAHQCHRLDRASGDHDRISSSLNTLAAIYMGARQPEQAEKFVLEGIEESKKVDNPARLATLMGMACEVYHSMGKEEKALDYAREAYRMEVALGRTDKAAMRQSQMAAPLHWLKRYDEAEQALRESLPVLKECGDYQSLAIGYNQLGYVLLDKTPADPAQAASYFDKALKILTQLHDIYNESHARYGLYRALKDSDPEAALREMERYKELKDSIYNQDAAMSLSMHNALLGNEVLQAQNQAEKASKRNAIIIGVGAALLLILIAAFIWWKMRQRNRRQRQENMRLNEHLEELRKEYRQLHLELDNAIAKKDMPQEDSDLLKQATAAVGKLIDEKRLDAQALATEMNLSTFQLRQRLQAITGEKTQEFILRVRIGRARHLLENHPELSVNEVAELCGYNDTPNFTRAFKKMLHVTPSQYQHDHLAPDDKSTTTI